MEKFSFQYKTTDFDADLLRLLPEDALLFDIETTGLSRDYCSVYLIGCGCRKSDTVTVELLFSPTPSDEADTIGAFLDMIKNYATLISYNGDSFDIKFIRERAKRHGIDAGILSRVRSLDLFKLVKKYSKFFTVPDCKQKTIEQYYGLFREDIYNGGQLIDIYKDYTKAPDPRLLDILLLHNHEDVKGMLTVMNVLELTHISEYLKLSADIDTSRPEEIIFFAATPLHQDIIVSDFYYTVSLKKDGITVILHPLTGELRHFYPDYKNYCYIPDEDLLIPKVLASTIDKTRLQRATKENCCVRHTGTYLPISDEKGHIFFDAADMLTYKKSHLDKQLFIEIDTNEISKEFIRSYIASLITRLF